MGSRYFSFAGRISNGTSVEALIEKIDFPEGTWMSRHTWWYRVVEIARGEITAILIEDYVDTFTLATEALLKIGIEVHA